MAVPGAGQQTPPFPAPQDQDLKNIIDKLANFVARNGTKFEEMTKSKQKDNPKFSFLFGGEYFNYYKWKVSVEIAQGKLMQPQLQPQGQPSFPNAQAAIVQQAIVQQSIQSAPWQQAQQIPVVTQQQQQPQTAQQPYSSPTDLNIQEFESHLLKIMQSCTKDNISNGKNWIFKNCNTNDHFKQVADYMLLRVTGAGMGFLHKLHIIYLINDVLHHAARKSIEDVKPVLQEVIIPIYCCTFVGESPENQQRLQKVIRIWETNSYFDSETIEKMKNAEQTKEKLDSSDIQDYSQGQYDYEQYGQNQYAPYDTSYQPPAQDSNQSTEPASKPTNDNQETKDLPEDISITEQEGSVREGDKSLTATVESSVEEQEIDQFEPQPPPHAENMPFNQVPPHPHPDQNFPYPPGNFPYDRPPEFRPFPPPGFPRPPFGQPPPLGFNGPMPPFDPNFVRAPPPSMGYPHCPPQQFDYNHGFPDQQPSTVHDYHHGQQGAPVMEEPPAPQAMYYELPAGLMVPLIDSSDVDYTPLTQEDVKLPPPQPPNERLVTAVDAFYSLPSHERPRNSEGWEAGALHEFYKTKLPFMKQRENREKVEKVKEMALKNVETKSPDNNKRSRSRSRSRSRGHSKSLSPKRRSRSRSPRRRSRSKSKSKSRSRSPRRRRSRSRSKSRSKSRSPKRRRSGSRERTPPPARRRSPTPPSFTGAYLQQSLNTRIDETNVGHKLLKKMGWEGAGLGKAEQGIQDPIKQGDIRDKQDMYKGIGIDLNDAFSQYRKNMSYSFNRRHFTNDDNHHFEMREYAEIIQAPNSELDRVENESKKIQLKTYHSRLQLELLFGYSYIEPQ